MRINLFHAFIITFTFMIIFPLLNISLPHAKFYSLFRDSFPLRGYTTGLLHALSVIVPQIIPPSQKIKMKSNKLKESTSDYLKILEEAKKQYEPYISLGELCDLLESMEDEQVEYMPPSPDNPLTTNKFRLPR